MATSGKKQAPQDENMKEDDSVSGVFSVKHVFATEPLPPMDDAPKPAEQAGELETHRPANESDVEEANNAVEVAIPTPPALLVRQRENVEIGFDVQMDAENQSIVSGLDTVGDNNGVPRNARAALEMGASRDDHNSFQGGASTQFTPVDPSVASKEASAWSYADMSHDRSKTGVDVKLVESLHDLESRAPSTAHKSALLLPTNLAKSQGFQDRNQFGVDDQFGVNGPEVVYGVHEAPAFAKTDVEVPTPTENTELGMLWLGAPPPEAIITRRPRKFFGCRLGLIIVVALVIIGFAAIAIGISLAIGNNNGDDDGSVQAAQDGFGFGPVGAGNVSPTGSPEASGTTGDASVPTVSPTPAPITQKPWDPIDPVTNTEAPTTAPTSPTALGVVSTTPPTKLPTSLPTPVPTGAPVGLPCGLDLPGTVTINGRPRTCGWLAQTSPGFRQPFCIPDSAIYEQCGSACRPCLVTPAPATPRPTPPPPTAVPSAFPSLAPIIRPTQAPVTPAPTVPRPTPSPTDPCQESPSAAFIANGVTRTCSFLSQTSEGFRDFWCSQGQVPFTVCPNTCQTCRFLQ